MVTFPCIDVFLPRYSNQVCIALEKRGFFYLSQLLTPQGTHLASWSVIYSNSPQKLGHGLVTKWYQDLFSNVTDSSQPGLLLGQFVSSQPVQSLAKDLTPCIPLTGSKETLDCHL
ncbi:unnamed protein product [Rhizophagus irregularis]|nr:unnamed protein product [Rhizophagus irregularis]